MLKIGKKSIKTVIASVLAVFCLSGPFMARSDDRSNEYYSIRLDKPTIAKGYTVAGFGAEIKLSLVPGILSDATGVELIKLDESLPMPWQLDRLSPVYQFEFKNKAAYDNHKPFYIQLSYGEKNDDYKQVFFYDKNFSAWRPLPTTDHPEIKSVRSLIHLPFARIAVFSYPGVMTVGRTSWYKYKGGNFAASPDFPKNSRLRVFNGDRSKFVDVTVNDYGPDRGLFPDRVIDLDRTAFAKIAPLGAGVVDVTVEPLYIPPDGDGRILGIPKNGSGESPSVDLGSAVVMDESTGRILWSKNAEAVRPLASLTKLVAVKVFLDTKPTLSRIVAYDKRDEEYNYEYFKPWESAKLSLSAGETLTVEDLLYASLVGSANNTIETLVRASGLKREDFISKMNDWVESLGATSTRFKEPTGLSPENVSSARDYAIITKEVLVNPMIQKASTMPEYRFTAISTGKAYRIKNTDHLIRTNNYDITGSKTGYLDEAGYCLMVRVAGSDGRNVIVVTMGAGDRATSFYETEELIKYGLRRSGSLY